MTNLSSWWKGDPFVRCNADPCSQNPCGVNADCESTGSRAVCKCRKGYEVRFFRIVVTTFLVLFYSLKYFRSTSNYPPPTPSIQATLYYLGLKSLFLGQELQFCWSRFCNMYIWKFMILKYFKSGPIFMKLNIS